MVSVHILKTSKTCRFFSLDSPTFHWLLNRQRYCTGWYPCWCSKEKLGNSCPKFSFVFSTLKGDCQMPRTSRRKHLPWELHAEVDPSESSTAWYSVHSEHHLATCQVSRPSSSCSYHPCWFLLYAALERCTRWIGLWKCWVTMVYINSSRRYSRWTQWVHKNINDILHVYDILYSYEQLLVQYTDVNRPIRVNMHQTYMYTEITVTRSDLSQEVIIRNSAYRKYGLYYNIIILWAYEYMLLFWKVSCDPKYTSSYMTYYSYKKITGNIHVYITDKTKN